MLPDVRRDGEVRIQRALKLANVDLGCLNVMASPSLFLHLFRQLVFLCSYLIRGTIPTSLLVLVEFIFTPFTISAVHSSLHSCLSILLCIYRYTTIGASLSKPHLVPSLAGRAMFALYIRRHSSDVYVGMRVVVCIP